MIIGREIGVEATIDGEHGHDNKIDVEKVKAEAKQKARAEVESNIGTIAALLAALGSILVIFLAFYPGAVDRKSLPLGKSSRKKEIIWGRSLPSITISFACTPTHSARTTHGFIIDRHKPVCNVCK